MQLYCRLLFSVVNVSTGEKDAEKKGKPLPQTNVVHCCDSIPLWLKSLVYRISFAANSDRTWRNKCFKVQSECKCIVVFSEISHKQTLGEAMLLEDIR